MHPLARLVASAALVLLTALPAAAEAPKTAGPDTALVRLGDASHGTAAFVAYPPGKGPSPAIVMAHEWWGLNVQIRTTAMRLAREGGYVVVVPDLYHGKVAEDMEQAHVLMRGIETGVTNQDFDAAIAWLRANPRVKGRLGTMGFCMGGGLALESGIHNPDVSAVVMFYGFPNTDVQQLANLKGPVMAHFGLKDDGIPQSKIDAFSAAMTSAGRTLRVFTYPSAGHAFMNDRRPSYNADAARQAWARTLDFLQKTLRD